MQVICYAVIYIPTYPLTMYEYLEFKHLYILHNTAPGMLQLLETPVTPISTRVKYNSYKLAKIETNMN